MGTPYLGEIRLVAFSYAMKGWAACNGQVLSIAQNTALFSLLGTYYGGNGTTTFALPNLQGRVPISFGQDPGGATSFVQGQAGGEETHTLTTGEWPSHSHAVDATEVTADSAAPAGALLAASGATPLYSAESPDATLAPQALASANASPQAHQNMQPFLTLNYVIALQGIYPSRP